jgi:hypothetical protein
LRPSFAWVMTAGYRLGCIDVRSHAEHNLRALLLAHSATRPRAVLRVSRGRDNQEAGTRYLAELFSNSIELVIANSLRRTSRPSASCLHRRSYQFRI